MSLSFTVGLTEPIAPLHATVHECLHCYTCRQGFSVSRRIDEDSQNSHRHNESVEEKKENGTSDF